MSRFVVIGGGISGLAAARFLAGAAPVSEPPPGADASPPERRWAAAAAVDEVVLLEASERLGGKVLTGSFAGGPVELGPDQFLRRNPSAERLCRLLGLGDDLVAPAAASAAVYAAGRPRQLPAGLVLGIPTDLEAVAMSGIVGRQGVEFAAGDAERPGPVLEAADVGLEAGGATDAGRERSAGAILRPRLGDEIVDRLIDPLIGGINAGSIDNLSLGTVAPQIARLLVGHSDVIAPLRSAGTGGSDEKRPSPFLGLAGGLGRLVGGLEGELRHLGCDVRLGCPARRLRRASNQSGYTVEFAGGEVTADGVVLALPAAHAAGLLQEVALEAAEQLSTISYGSVAVVTFAFDEAMPDDVSAWSGILVPRLEGTLMTALTLLSQKWPWVSTGSPERPLARVSAGRHGDRRIDSLSDGELSEALVAELATAAGVTAPVSDCRVQRWAEAFPQYAPGFAARMGTVQRLLHECGALALAGAALGGIGLPACITSGELAAEAVRTAVPPVA
jgi:oxygen-dependent protoporphyrinogen oxidase